MHRDAGAVEPDQHRLGLDAVDAQADEMRGAGPRDRPAPTTSTPSTASAAVHHRRRSAGGAVAASSSMARPPSLGQRRRGGTEGQQRRDRLEPAAPAALLRAADEQRFEPAAPPHDQRPGAGNAAELVRADAHQVGVEGAEVGRHVPAGGGGVDVDGHARVAAERDHLVDRLEGAHLVVGPLAVHEGGTRQPRRPESGAQRVDVDPAGAVDRAASRPAPVGPRRRGRPSARPPRTSTGAPGAARQAPHTAALIASVAPEVKTTWRGAAPRRPATSARASSSASRTMRPSSCSRPGSPGGSAAQRLSAATASGRAGVVLAWSR